MRLTKEQSQLLHLTGVSLFHNRILTSIPEEILCEARNQTVLPLIYQAEREPSGRWMRIVDRIFENNIRVDYEHTEVHKLLSSNHIPYVVLKGSASASYYHEPMFRTMGDVDFLVYPDDLEQAGKVLESAGFQAAENDKGGLHIAYHRAPNSIWEMHQKPNGIPSGEAGELISGYLSDVIESAVPYETQDGIILMPSRFHHGLILLLHTVSHLICEGVGLRHLCDWAVFVESMSEQEFTDLFEEKLKACGLWRFAQILTLCCVEYLECPKKGWEGEAEPELLQDMICDILRGGNFGQKDADRYRQIKYISNRGTKTVDEKSAIQQVWNTIEEKAKQEQKSRLIVMTDYFRMVLRGERKPDSKSTLNQAEERKRIYAEFHLFEPDCRKFGEENVK